jgi:iron complex transport system ATP-binding protein
VLSGVELELAQGEVLALLGTNGAGKSTLLRLLLGFEKPCSGEVLVSGRAIRALSRRELSKRIAYVPQAHHAPFPYPVREVVVLGRIAHAGLFREPGAVDRRRVEEVLSRIGIAALSDRPYTDLSGGERQLVLVARALAQDARVLVLDEPASSLDYGNQLRLLGTLRRLADGGLSILFTTHRPEHALLAADRVAVLEAGRISANGPAASVLSPQLLRRLYGAEVELLERPEGGLALWPRLGESWDAKAGTTTQEDGGTR